jgi:hypothetical protein
MISRDLRANATLTERFGHLLYWLFEGMAADWRRRGLRHVHNGEITQRIGGLWKRFRSVVARWEAGTLRPVVSRQGSVVSEEVTPHPGPPPQERERGRAQRAVPGWSVLPRRFGWLKALLLPDRQHCVLAFNWLLLDDADMKAIIAEAPVQIGRVLRPFCHILGLEVPAELRLPKRRKVRKKDTSPRPSPQSGEGAKGGGSCGGYPSPSRSAGPSLSHKATGFTDLDPARGGGWQLFRLGIAAIRSA